MATEKTATVASDPTFSKDQLLAAKRYADRRDLLNVLLTAERQYTFAQVNAAIDNFLKKEVK